MLKTIKSSKSQYSQIDVVEEYPFRHLFFDLNSVNNHGICREQSAIRLDNLRFNVYDYSLLSMYVFRFVPHPNNILCIGCGAGVVPREINYYYPHVQIDVLEIDPEVVSIAKEYFYYEDGQNIATIIGDAFQTIDSVKTNYDIIVLDAMFSNYVPMHLMSKEFLNKVKNKNALLAINVANIHYSYNNYIATLYHVFGDHLYFVKGQRNLSMTLVFVFDKEPAHPLLLPSEYYPDYKIEKFIINEEILSSKIFSLSV
jgi:spermidine synthase